MQNYHSLWIYLFFIEVLAFQQVFNMLLFVIKESVLLYGFVGNLYL